MGLDKTTYKNLVPNYPDNIHLYSSNEFGGHINSIDNGAYSNFKKKIEMASESNTPQIVNSEGMFDKYANGYRVARDGRWKNDSGEPYTLFCHQPTATGTIYCNTSYRLKTGVQIEFGFVTPESDIDLVAKKVDENVHAIIKTLVAK
ncbi:hypothetical protein ACO0K9_26045 [Undibacterium sp. Ji50W]|uniref:hypothetical protein n=1 Tax=Undibacterium sp. Ji50W TaxID=3413041 RepID=UPI003BF0ACF7